MNFIFHFYLSILVTECFNKQNQNLVLGRRIEEEKNSEDEFLDKSPENSQVRCKKNYIHLKKNRNTFLEKKDEGVGGNEEGFLGHEEGLDRVLKEPVRKGNWMTKLGKLFRRNYWRKNLKKAPFNALYRQKQIYGDHPNVNKRRRRRRGRKLRYLLGNSTNLHQSKPSVWVKLSESENRDVLEALEDMRRMRKGRRSRNTDAQTSLSDSAENVEVDDAEESYDDRAESSELKGLKQKTYDYAENYTQMENSPEISISKDTKNVKHNLILQNNSNSPTNVVHHVKSKEVLRTKCIQGPGKFICELAKSYKILLCATNKFLKAVNDTVREFGAECSSECTTTCRTTYSTTCSTTPCPKPTCTTSCLGSENPNLEIYNFDFCSRVESSTGFVEDGTDAGDTEDDLPDREDIGETYVKLKVRKRPIASKKVDRSHNKTNACSSTVRLGEKNALYEESEESEYDYDSTEPVEEDGECEGTVPIVSSGSTEHVLRPLVTCPTKAATEVPLTNKEEISEPTTMFWLKKRKFNNMEFKDKGIIMDHTMPYHETDAVTTYDLSTVAGLSGGAIDTLGRDSESDPTKHRHNKSFVNNVTRRKGKRKKFIFMKKALLLKSTGRNVQSEEDATSSSGPETKN